MVDSLRPHLNIFGGVMNISDDIIDAEEVKTEVEQIEIEEDATEDHGEFNCLDESAKEFIEQLISNSLLPIDTEEITLYTSIRSLEEEEEDEPEELISVKISDEQRVSMVESKMRELKYIVQSTNFDFSQIDALRDSNDEKHEEYIGIVDDVVLGAKILAKKKSTREDAVNLMSELLSWMMKNNKKDAYDYLTDNIGSKLLKKVLWNTGK